MFVDNLQFQADYIFGLFGFLLATGARVIWNRQNALETAQKEQAKELRRAIHESEQMIQQQHAKLRDQLERQHNRLLEILIHRNGQA